MKQKPVAPLLLSLLGVLAAPALVAQEALGPMGGVGGELRRVENQALSAAAPKAAAAEKPAAASAPALPAVPAADDGPRCEIAAVRLTGDLAFADKLGVRKTLEARLAGGTPKSRRDIQEALRAVYRDFVEKGYYLGRVTLPRDDYDPASKTLTVLVEAGLFGETRIKFTGDRKTGRYFSREQLARKFQDIKPGETFNYQQFYRDLCDVNMHPDLTVDTTLSVRKAVEGEGDARRVVRYADMDLEVKESLPLHAVFDLNNFGTESVDEWQAALTLQYLNLTHADDVLTVSPAMSLDSSLLSLAGSYMRPHDLWKGGATTVYGGWSDLETEDIVPHIDLVGQGWFAGLVHSQVLVDDQDRLISLSLGLVYRYIEDQFASCSTTLQQRDVSVLPLSIALSYSARKPDFLRGRNFATLQGIYNLAAAGGNKLEDMRVGADDNYLIARLQLARLQPLFGTLDASAASQIHQWILFLKAEGQYASCPLMPAEQLALGGHNTVRGYVTKGYFGDNGVYGTVELRTPILVDLVSHLFGRTAARNPLDRLQFVAFTDMGYIETIDPLPGQEESETLLSAGGGLRLAVTQYSQMRLDVGVPVSSASGDDDSSEYYLDWQLQF